jgi:hypothetical protein
LSQSSLVAAILFAMFLVFVAARGRLPAYTDVLWGGGGKGGGTIAPDKSKGEGEDKFDEGEALDLAAEFLPPPFNLLYKVGDIVV